ncbi:hypothetical protein [Halovenus aranensis]|nr:hypothetical protein [Halovenus aranensis]
MNRRRIRTVVLVAVGLAVLVAMAGCSMTVPFGDDTDDSGPATPDGTETPSPEAESPSPSAGDRDSGSQTETPGGADSDSGPDDGESTTENGDTAEATGEEETTGPISDTGLPVDENRVYNLTRDLLGSDADAPTVSVEELNYRSGETDRPFFEYMGLTNDTEGGSTGAASAAVAEGPNSVVVNEDVLGQYENNSVDRFGLLLAHEFAHTIQMEEGWSRAELARKLDLSTSESLMLYRSLVEGGAVFTADQYADEEDLELSQIARFDRQYGAAPDEQVYAYAPYHHGGQYFDTVLDAATGLGAVYTDDTPASTEAVLHPEYNDTEPSRVSFSATSNRTGWERQRSTDDRLGSLFVHVVMTAHADRAVAEKASKGWANDKVFGFENGSNSAFAWATHWDTADDADEFAVAFNRTLTSRTDESATNISVARAGNRSVVVLTGPRTFRNAIAIDGENATLDITLQADSDGSVDTWATDSPSRQTAVTG